jgi:hypothetical protein
MNPHELVSRMQRYILMNRFDFAVERQVPEPSLEITENTQRQRLVDFPPVGTYFIGLPGSLGGVQS